MNYAKMRGLKPDNGSLNIISAIVILFTLLFSLVINTQAQNTEPVREAVRVAPEREALILEQRPLEGNATEVLIQIPAVADTYIASQRPSQNFSADSLFLGYNLTGANNFGAQRILLRFNVKDNIPGNAIINSAILRLRLNLSVPSNDVAMGTVLRRLASPWSETTVTWNTEPDWTPIDDVTNVGSSLTWYEWEVTDLVDDWHDDVYPNYGVEIIGDETIQERERAFYSRESATSFFPQLLVDYEVSSDTTPPQTTMSALPTYSPASFTVSWSGSDSGGSGIDYYDVQVRIDDGAWQDWLLRTDATSAEYGDGENGRLYAFRVRAVDRADNVEPFGAAQASTIVDSEPPNATVNALPATTTMTTSFTVSWQSDASVSGIQYFDVQFRVGTGPWQLWQSNVTDGSAVFTASGDETVRFEARAVDNAGRVEPFLNKSEASTAVDVVAPFISPKLRLPLIWDQN